MSTKRPQTTRLKAVRLEIDIINVPSAKPRVVATLRHKCGNRKDALYLIKQYLEHNKKGDA